LAAVGNDNLRLWSSGLRAQGFHLLQDGVSRDQFAENDVLAIEPLGIGSADEELRSVGVWSSVSHGQAALICEKYC
jgi:hypothetical protein